MRKVLFIFIITGLISVIYGCRGNEQSKLVGVWKYIPFTKPDETNYTTWEFYAGDALVIINHYEKGVDSTTYTYSIESTTFNIFASDDSPDYAPAAGDPRGEYWVDELTDSNFKITKRKHPDGSTDAVYLRIELVKQ